MNSRLFIFGLLLLVAACGGDSKFDENSRIATVEIPDAPEYCFIDNSYQQGPLLCFPDAVADNGEYVSPTSIGGFDYNFGTSYKLRIRIYDIETPDADAPSIGYELVEVLEETTAPVGTVYAYENVQLVNLPFRSVDDGLYSMGFLQFQCSDGIDCDYLVENGESGGAVNIEFTLTDGDVPVALSNWN